METAQEMLAAHPFLAAQPVGAATSQRYMAGLAAPALTRLSFWSRRQTFHAGARLFEEGTRADRFWLIKDGHVALDLHVPIRGRAVVETLGPGEVLGWSWLFPPYRWHFGASAVETTLAIALDGPGVRGLCEQDPALGYALLGRFIPVVVNRLQATRLRLLDLYRDEP